MLLVVPIVNTPPCLTLPLPPDEPLLPPHPAASSTAASAAAASILRELIAFPPGFQGPARRPDDDLCQAADCERPARRCGTPPPTPPDRARSGPSRRWRRWRRRSLRTPSIRSTGP